MPIDGPAPSIGANRALKVVVKLSEEFPLPPRIGCQRRVARSLRRGQHAMDEGGECLGRFHPSSLTVSVSLRLAWKAKDEHDKSDADQPSTPPSQMQICHEDDAESHDAESAE